MPAVTLQAGATIQAAADKPATVRIVAYSGAVMRPPGWGELAIDLDALELPASVPLLLDHQNAINSIAGSGVPSVESGALIIVGELARDTEAGQRVIALSRARVALQASVGVEPVKTEIVKPGASVVVNGRRLTAGRDGLTVIRAGELRETSIVALGADKSTSVAIAARRASHREAIMHEQFTDWAASVCGDVSMMTAQQLAGLHANWRGETEATDADRAAVAPMIRASADPVDQEHRRLRQIEAACRGEWGQHAERVAELRASAIGGELTVDDLIQDLRAVRVERLEARTPVAHTISAGRGSAQGELLTAALCLQGDLSGVEKQFPEQLLDQADKMVRGGLTLQTVLMQAAVSAGYDARPGESISMGNLKSVLAAAFAPSIRAQGWSYANIGNVVSNTANKFLLDGFAEMGDEWRSIAAIKPVKNFKPATFVRLLDSLEFEKLGAAGEIKHGELGDATMTAKADTYAKMLSITRQDILNDDPGALTDLPRRLGRAAGQRFRRLFWETFLAADSFFDATNGNVVTGAGTELDAAGVGMTAALQAFRSQRTPAADGAKLIGGAPAVCLVPPALEIPARRLLNSSNIVSGGASDVSTIGSANPFAGLATLVVADWIGTAGGLSGADDDKWYLFRAPNLAPAMLVAALNGRVEPTVDTAEADFNTLGIQMRGYSDVGCSRGEPLCGLQMTGTPAGE